MYRKEVRKGVGKIRFLKIAEIAELKDPRQNFNVRQSVIEVRRCPLYGTWCRINVERALRERHVPEQEILDTINKLAQETVLKCVFCRENVSKSTPRFHNLDIEIIEHGKVVICPNLFPFARTHAIAILNPDVHYVHVGNLSEDVVYDLLVASREYFTKLLKHDGKLNYQYVNLNYLFPAGASIVHPHAQIFASRRPTYMHELLMRRCRAYYRKTGRDLIQDYIESELQERERVVYTDSKLVIFAPFAPIANYEIDIFLNESSSLLDLDESTLKILAHHVHKILHTLNTVFKQYSVNMALFSCTDRRWSSHKLHVKIVCRKEPTPTYVNDIGFMELLHREPVLVTLPEDYARKVRY